MTNNGNNFQDTWLYKKGKRENQITIMTNHNSRRCVIVDKRINKEFMHVSCQNILVIGNYKNFYAYVSL